MSGEKPPAVCFDPGGGDQKLDCVLDFAGECGIDDHKRVAFVDDKPENLRAAAVS